MNFLGLAANVIIVVCTLTAIMVIAVAAYRRLPRPDPLPARTARPAGQSDVSSSAAHLARLLREDPLAVHSMVLAASRKAGVASADEARTEQLLPILEAHLGLAANQRSSE